MLEDRMKSLEEALRENTAALIGHKPKSDKSEKEDAAGEAPARRSRATKEDKEDDAPARRSRATKEDKEDKKEKPKSSKMSLDDVRAAYADYLGPKEGKDYDDNAEFVGAVLDEVGADTLRGIKEDDFAKVMHWLELKLDGRKVNFDTDLPEEAEERPRSRRRID